MTRGALTFLAALLCLGCFILVTNGTALPTKKPRAVEAETFPIRILMIGDSLSAGPFGETVQQHLARKYGPQNVAAYASCGSSPEHWLAAEPGFYTKCGYREAAPGRRPIYTEGGTGRRILTPKLETLVQRHRPTIVILQLGTNWMDRDLSPAQMSSYADRLVRAARGGNDVRQIIWIAPPDSSAIRRTAQTRIHALIQQAARRNRFEVIDSRQLTRYVPGKTGGDGVHYNSDASRAWAGRINGLLDRRVSGQLVRNR